MDLKINNVAETCALVALVLIAWSASAWAGPPPPPVIAAQIPATPVGNAEVSTATIVALAAYGYWKSGK